jgi:hypothetical protein
MKIRAVMAILLGETVIKERIDHGHNRDNNSKPFEYADLICTTLMKGIKPLEAFIKAQKPYFESDFVGMELNDYARRGAALFAGFLSGMPQFTEHERKILRVLADLTDAPNSLGSSSSLLDDDDTLNESDDVDSDSENSVPRKRTRDTSDALEHNDREPKRITRESRNRESPRLPPTGINDVPFDVYGTSSSFPSDPVRSHFKGVGYFKPESIVGRAS